MGAVSCGLHCGCLIENNVVIVLDTSELLVRNLHCTVGEQVHLILLDDLIKFFCLIVIESCLNLSPLVVNEFNVEQSTCSLCILPLFLGLFLSDPSLDLPIKQEGIQTLDRGVLIFFGCSNSSRFCLGLSLNVSDFRRCHTRLF